MGAAAGPRPPILLSTASVFPEGVDVAFAMAADLGYDGIELMVWTDPVSQDIGAVDRLADRHGTAVRAVHAPCLAVTQRVWSPDPLVRLRRSVDAAVRLGAATVVVHPPFRWQRSYAAVFAEQVRVAGQDRGVAVAVENMPPLRRAGLSLVPYDPGIDPTEGRDDAAHPHYVLDLSHTATAGQDALGLLDRMGERLAHLHLTDGSGGPRDEHLVPGRGTQPCAAVCATLARRRFPGTVAVEISTRACRTRSERVALLAESLLFAQLHLTSA